MITTPEGYKQLLAEKSSQKESKYKNKRKKVAHIVDGKEKIINFDSTKEANYYEIYENKKRNGKILDFKYHQAYKFIMNGVKICSYEADFVLTHLDGSVEVVDVKSSFTRGMPVYSIKKKLMKAFYNIEIQEV